MHPIDFQRTKKAAKVREMYPMYIHTCSFRIHVRLNAAFAVCSSQYEKKFQANGSALALSVTDKPHLLPHLTVHLTIYYSHSDNTSQLACWSPIVVFSAWLTVQLAKQKLLSEEMCDRRKVRKWDAFK